MWPKFINTVPADALGLNGTRLYADTVLTLRGVFDQSLLLAVKRARKITFEDMWLKFINTVPTGALELIEPGYMQTQSWPWKGCFSNVYSWL